MARSKRTIRASEIGTFVFCQRAWWYQRKKIKSLNQEEMTDGTEFHSGHWLQTQSITPLRSIAWIMLLIALVILGIYFRFQFNG